MTLRQELALTVVLAAILLPLGFAHAPDLIAFWPYPVAVSGDPVLVSDAEIPVLRP